MEFEDHCRIYNCLPLAPFQINMNPVLQSYSCKLNFNIVLPSTPMFEKGVLGGIYGLKAQNLFETGENYIGRNEELYKLYLSPNLIRIIKLKIRKPQHSWE